MILWCSIRLCVVGCNCSVAKSVTAAVLWTVTFVNEGFIVISVTHWVYCYWVESTDQVDHYCKNFADKIRPTLHSAWQLKSPPKMSLCLIFFSGYNVTLTVCTYSVSLLLTKNGFLCPVCFSFFCWLFFLWSDCVISSRFVGDMITNAEVLFGFICFDYRPFQ